MNLELSDAEAEALIQDLSGTINDARYPLAPRIQTLRAILAKIRPEPVHEPLPPPKVYAPQRAIPRVVLLERLRITRAGTRYSFLSRPVYIVIAFVGLLANAGGETLQAMKIDGYQQSVPTVLGYADAWNIFADGVIDEGASERLKKFLADNNIPGDSSLYLNSNGGSLGEGMRLGKVIREHGLFTYVGRSDSSFSKIYPGECYSACSLTYLGGIFRFSYSGSSYGVHRFYAPPNDDFLVLRSLKVKLGDRIALPPRVW